MTALIILEKPVIRWTPGNAMFVDKSCLACRNVWQMHHRCPALGGRFNCC